jgi:alanine racemase
MRARAEAVIDLAAIRSSVGRLVDVAPTAAVMAVVKADGYGHGLLPSARAALEGGATWLGTAVLEEALALRAAGITAPILSWLAVPGEALVDGVRADVDLSASAVWMLEELAAAARQAGRPARVHLKVDTGLSRAGATPDDWPELVRTGLRLQAEGVLELVGAWSHFARADAPADPTVLGQVEVFREALAIAEGLGFVPLLRHLANSAATLANPQAHFDLVRPGISVYGLSPGPDVGTAEALGLVPAMTLRASLALVKQVPAGSGVSYGHRYVTEQATTLGLVPIGYADGVPRAATNGAEVFADGRRLTIAGTVCMDQFVLDLGPDSRAAAGDDVVLFGPGDQGEPTAQDWADAVGTINYEIVTRIGLRVPRRYVGAATSEPA